MSGTPCSSTPAVGNFWHFEHIALVLESLRKLTGRTLVSPELNGVEAARAVFKGGFVLVSHGTEADPLFNYGNRMALELFEMSWDEFIALPSRRSTESPGRTERARLLREVADKGFIDNYSGTRISSSGRRFLVEHALVWNVRDRDGRPYGQAATFEHWRNAGSRR